MIKPFSVLGDKVRGLFEDRTDFVPWRETAQGRTEQTVVPWWVDVLTNWGRPVVAAVVLAMCAPGEHYLANQAGWSTRLAWGMPFVLTAYAGISAVVATKRPKGSPGKRTAVAGAILSILLAMTAQPVAHLYGRPGGLMGPWDTHKTLIVVASCIPALVLGHLLHLAVSHVPTRTSSAAVPEDKDNSEDMSRPMGIKDTPVLQDKTASSGTQWLFEDRTYRAGVPVSPVTQDRMNAVLGKPTVRPVPGAEDTDQAHEDMKAYWAPVLGDNYEDKTAATASASAGVPEDVPAPSKDVRTQPGTATASASPAGDDLSSRRKLTDVIKDARASVGDNADAIKDAVLQTPGFEDMRSTPQKRNTLNTAVRRALSKIA